jgi:UDP-glucuronate 4-epimerase
MRVLITGAAGFIGSHLAERLLDRGDHVIAIDEFNDYYDPAVKRSNIAGAMTNARFSLHVLDVRDRDRLFEVFALAKADVIVHLAARAGVRPSMQDPNLYHAVNIIGTQNIIDACRANPPSHCVAASSSSVYGGLEEVPFREDMDISKVISPYAATKRMNELMAHVYSHNFGMRFTMLRFFTVFGPRQRPDMAIHKFTQLIDDGKPVPMFGDGSTRRDYTYIDDIIDGVIKCIDTPFPFEIFNLGESQTTSLSELIAIISKCLNKPATIEQRPMEPGDVLITFADISKARALLGYNPHCSVEVGIKRFVEWFRTQRIPARQATN